MTDLSSTSTVVTTTTTTQLQNMQRWEHLIHRATSILQSNNNSNNNRNIDISTLLHNNKIAIKCLLTALNIFPDKIQPIILLCSYFKSIGDNEKALTLGMYAMQSEDVSFPLTFLYDMGSTCCHVRGKKELGLFLHDCILHATSKEKENNDATFKKIDFLAKYNIHLYLPCIESICPSFQLTKLIFNSNTIDSGFKLCNPSVVLSDKNKNKLLINMRSVNYLYDQETCKVKYSDCVQTNNYIVQGFDCANINNNNKEYILDDNSNNNFDELKPYNCLNSITWNHSVSIKGLEDIRLFWCRKRLWGLCATFMLKQTLTQCLILFNEEQNSIEKVFLVEGYGNNGREKNWSPIQRLDKQQFMNKEREEENEEMEFVYKVDPLVILRVNYEDITNALDISNKDMMSVQVKPIRNAIDNPYGLVDGYNVLSFTGYRGNTNTMQLKDKTFLTLVHGVGYGENNNMMKYYHRFIRYNKDINQIVGISKPFYFTKNAIEFAVGLALIEDNISNDNNDNGNTEPSEEKIIITFGVFDCEAFISSISLSEVLNSMNWTPCV